MSNLLHDLIYQSNSITPEAQAISYRGSTFSYKDLTSSINKVARGLLDIGLSPNERVAIYLPKLPASVISMFGVSLAGGVFVPVNPLLKAEQVAYILRDCNVRILVTSKDRMRTLLEVLPFCHDLHTTIIVDTDENELENSHLQTKSWQNLIINSADYVPNKRIDTDMAAILYTSGSTGKPKGVVLSHRNMVSGAKSVAHYLENNSNDKLLCVLPFSFDYGFSQLTTAFHVGGCAVLMDYLLPRDVINTVAKENITGLAAVPPLWIQLAQLPWPKEAVSSLRYYTNSGGAMPLATIEALKKALPKTRPYLMYGLTEAFRSTYLPPDEVEKRPLSIGKAIPNAEILVVREDGSQCAPGEPGELVHRGSLVAMGYWNDHEKTSQRFRPVPGQEPGLPIPEMAVWSGDVVHTDEDGYLYFISRKDEMIKTSGYRVSPTEIEEVVYQTGMVSETVALGIPHSTLGQAILVVATPISDRKFDSNELLMECKKRLPAFMVPAVIVERIGLPRNQNGKIDRKHLTAEYIDMFQES